VKRAEGGAISADKAGRLLHIATSTVLKRWHNGRLIAWTESEAPWFPVWQFRRGKVLPGIEALLRVFRSLDQWRVVVYFLCTRLSLGSKRPLDLLRLGETKRVIEHAKAHAEANTW
jgi:hypothetical protein